MRLVNFNTLALVLGFNACSYIKILIMIFTRNFYSRVGLFILGQAFNKDFSCLKLAKLLHDIELIS